MKDKNKVNSLLLMVSFVVYIFGFLLLFIFIKDKDYSEIENRNLTKLPEFTFEKLLNKEFGDTFEKYVADQFPIRDKFIAVKSYSELIMQKKENNGVYIGKDGFFIEKFNRLNKETMGKIAQYINKFSDKYNTYMMIAPTSMTVYKDKLPAFVDGNKEEEVVSEFKEQLNKDILMVNVDDSLIQNNDKYLYYKTDHHWTTLGAYYAYKELCNIFNIKPNSLEDYNITEVSDKFYGTLFSKGNFGFAKPDSINLFYDKKDIKVNVEYVSEGKTSNSLYEMEYLNKKDKYGVFLDNNHPLLKITSNIENGKKICIIKDSYSHSLIPFLVSHFEEIHVIDLRHYNGSTNKYLEENQIEDVLFIYNARNIVTDVSTMKLNR